MQNAPYLRQDETTARNQKGHFRGSESALFNNTAIAQAKYPVKKSNIFIK
jgi:hypothetical protein